MRAQTSLTFSALALGLLLGTSCSSSSWSTRVQGEGPFVPDQRQLADFDTIELSGGMRLDVEVGGPQSVIIHADENLHEYIRTRIEDGTLEIDFTESVSTQHELRAEIRVPELKGIEVAGSCKMTVTGIEAEHFEVDVAGAASGTLSGRAGGIDVDVAGSSDLDLSSLECREAVIDIAGSAKIDVAASDSLDVDIAGSGVVRYRGQPAVSLDQAGSGKVVPLQEE